MALVNRRMQPPEAWAGRGGRREKGARRGRRRRRCGARGGAACRPRAGTTATPARVRGGEARGGGGAHGPCCGERVVRGHNQPGWGEGRSPPPDRMCSLASQPPLAGAPPGHHPRRPPLPPQVLRRRRRLRAGPRCGRTPPPTARTAAPRTSTGTTGGRGRRPGGPLQPPLSRQRGQSGCAGTSPQRGTGAWRCSTARRRRWP